MMFIGMNPSQELIRADQAKKNERYVCPSCQQDLILKQGPIKHAHFAHYQQSTCQTFSEAESEEHLRAKLLLFKWLSQSFDEVEMEAYLSDLCQRPDLLFTDQRGLKICVEIQCSSLSLQRMVERTTNYLKHGYKVWWILGKNLNIQKDQVTHLQKSFIHGLNNKLCLFHLDCDRQLIFTYTHIQCSSYGKLFYQSRSFPLSTSTYDDLLHYCWHVEAPQLSIESNLSLYHRKWMRALKFRQKNMLPLIEKLYQQGQSLQTCSHLIYIDLAYDCLLASHPMLWKFKLVCWLRAGGIEKEIHLSDYYGYCQSLKVDYFIMPLVDQSFYFKWYDQFLEMLVKEGYIRWLSASRFQLIKDLAPYKNEQEKLNCLNAL